MYPGPMDPDLGVFVAQMEAALRERGHEIDLAVLDRRAGGETPLLGFRAEEGLGGLTERKNVVRLADAFATLGRGSLTFVGDGPLRGSLDGRPGVTTTGRVGHEDVPRYLAAADVVCAPSLIEPFGQAILEAMAC